MISFLQTQTSRTFATILFVAVFAVMTFACITMSTTNNHGGMLTNGCQQVMTIMEDIALQTGTLLMLLGVVAFGVLYTPFAASIFEIYRALLLRMCFLGAYCCNGREYSYLCYFFRVGLVHPKLYNTAI